MKSSDILWPESGQGEQTLEEMESVHSFAHLSVYVCMHVCVYMCVRIIIFPYPSFPTKPVLP